MKLNFTISGEIELPEGTTIPEGRSDVICLVDGTLLELDVNVEPTSVVEAKDVRYALTFKSVISYTPDHQSRIALAAVIHPEAALESIDHPLGLMSTHEFGIWLSTATKTTPKALIYNFVVGHDQGAHFSKVTVGQPLYNSQEIEQLKERYSRMVHAIDYLYTKGFVVKELQLIGIQGNQGAKLRYTTPNGRLHTQEYIRIEGPEAMIPDDFLHDLDNIPNRIY